MPKYHLKEYVQNLLTNSGLSQKAFSEKLNIGHSTLKDAIRGITSLPQPRFLDALSKYTNTSKYKVLQNIIFYEYTDEIKNNKDFDALTLYACYLYTKEWSFVNTYITEGSIIDIFEEEDNGWEFTKTHASIILKKSVYPDRAMFLQNIYSHEYIPLNDFSVLYKTLQEIEYRNSNILKDYSYLSFDIVFALDNNKKNEEYVNRFINKKLLKPDHCNSISFILFDRKNCKVAKKITN